MAPLFPQLLWDLLPSRKRAKDATGAASPPRGSRSPRPSGNPPGTASGKVTARQLRYDELVGEMKQIYRLRVNKWRSSTSGCAWEVQYADGRVSRLIESPYPRGPMSCAVFMHEVGHHAIGLHRYRPRCLEEYHAWRWGLEQMERRGYSVTERVYKRRDDALRYAVGKALRRGLKRLPVELAPWAPPGILRQASSSLASSGEHVDQ
jgi:hypothetical protein